MRYARVVVAVLVSCAVWGWAETPVNGWIKVGEGTLEPTHAVAIRDVSTGFEPGSKIIHVIMATAPIDTSGVATALDPERAIRDTIEGDFAIVTVKEDGSLHYVYVYFDDGAKNYGFRGGTAETKSISEEQVVSHAFTEKQESLGDTPYTYDVSFTSAILAERPPGKDLGGDGGAPGAAYLALIKAKHAGDVETMVKHLEKGEAQQLAEVDDDWRSYKLDDLKENAPQEMKVVGGELFDGWAILQVKGKDWSGDTVEGKVKMVSDGDSWRYQEEDLDYVW